MTTADEISQANAVTPLSAVQNEYSTMERTFEKDVIPLGVGLVTFSAYGKWFFER